MRPVPLLLLWLSLLGLSGRPLQAQDAAPVGTIQGTVLDASTSVELPGSQVTLLPRGGDGALPSAGAGTSFVNAHTTTTVSGGSYRFTNLPSGEYTLLVRRVGYEPARLDVTLGSAGDARLSIGLMVLPVRLQPVSIEASRLQTARDSLAANEGELRVAAARERQRMFLSTDVREITTADVQEAATLGSGDVLLAMQRLPSVTHVSQGSASMWVRGARWGQTRVYFDGIPLFEPLGGQGTVSAIGAFGIGGAFLHPGVRAVSLGGEGATRIDLHSPAGVADGKVHGAAEASLHGLSGALAHRTADGRLGVRATGRGSIGYLTEIDHFPYGERVRRFNDVTVRADAALGRGRIDASGILLTDRRLAQSDRSDGSALDRQLSPDSVHRRSIGGRLALSHPLGSMRGTLAATVSQYYGRTMLALLPTRALGESLPLELQFRPGDATADYAGLAFRLDSRDAATSPGWGLGMEVHDHRTEFSGARQHLLLGALAEDEIRARADVRYGSVWGERRWQVTPTLAVEAGLRTDLGGRGLEAVRPAPSLLVRQALTPATSLSLGAGRTFQYTQHIDVPARGLAITSAAGPTFADHPEVPLLVVDHATAGIEYWQSSGTLVAANLYARQARGAVLAERHPGPLVDRPLFEAGDETSAGLELSARKLTGRLTGMVAYSVGRSSVDADGMSVVAASDRTYALDATTVLRLGRWRLGAAYTRTAGDLFTRVVPGTYVNHDPASGWQQPPIADRPNDLRAPAHSSLDLMVDWTVPIRRTRVSLFGGITNVLASSQYSLVVLPPDWSGGCQNVSGVQCRDGAIFAGSENLGFSLGLRFSF